MPRSIKEHSNVSSQPQSNLTTGQAVTSYLSTLTHEEKSAASQELNNFARWYGGQKPIASLTPPDLEGYQGQLTAQARTDKDQRLEVIKRFLAEAKKQGWTSRNLAVEIKVKRSKAAAAARKSASSNGDVIRLTREGHDKLSKELQHLETVGRDQIALELKTAAADKDFRENAPYDVAKNRQGEMEARIRELKGVLLKGEVVEEAEHAHVVDMGSMVTVRDLDEDEQIVYTIVGPGEVDARKHKISDQSPVGKALSGKVRGDVVEVTVPAGTLRFRVEKVERR